MKLKHLLFISTIVVALTSCKSHKANEDSSISDDVVTQVVNFDGVKAYGLVKAQCDFGPRVPGTPAHSKCAEWLEKSLKDNCDTMIVQQGQVTTFDGKALNIKNFVGSFNPDNSDRILLLAHWDCRPWADNDPDPAKQKEPVMGANDAASGVAVLLQLAQLMKEKKPSIGVDILLVDAEDWGDNNVEDSWALGTQYWAAHPHVEGYTARFGILLDMVGAKGAKFFKEPHSLYYAQDVVNEVWDVAQKSGYGAYFIDKDGEGFVTDDHVVINEMGIECIDIIDTRQQGTFFAGWHTTDDTIHWIDQNVLKAVGQVIANVVYGY